ncbi:hypothetical protein GCM10028794_07390 [Silanimonas algicola]
MPSVSRVRPVLALALFALAGLSVATASAQPADGYIGPETSSEPQPAVAAKSGRYGGGWSGDWRFCAEEGRRCSVRGWGVVRYGTQGRYVYREVRNASLQCDNSMFGDPAPGRGKRCEIRQYDDTGWGGGGDDGYGWTLCARENETCRVDGPATVRFGTNGRYYERRVRGGSVACSIQTFGDPAPRERKVCELRYDGGGRPGSGGGWGGSWSGGWTPCARENEVCRLPGPATVRYGTERRFTDLEVRGGSVRCDNRGFGDPAPGEVKHCSFRTGGGWQGGGPGNAWTECATEGGFCSFRGRRSIWYGSDDGRSVTREFRDGVSCTNAAFGGDPAPRSPKRCAIQRY